MSQKYTTTIAHVRKTGDKWAEPHLLETHLLKVALLAGKFAAKINGENWASLAGKWHDLGKYRTKFQDYIRLQNDYECENAHIENGKRAPHSTAGAIHAVAKLGPGLGHILAYLIAGHHAGLPDWVNARSGLGYRLINSQQEYEEAMTANIPAHILAGERPSVPAVAQSSETLALWMRILFSCLVDADFLDTESYMDSERARQRLPIPSLIELQQRFNENMLIVEQQARETPLQAVRTAIRQACLKAAQWQPGMFSLTVPTGGGKTLSSLAFALEHGRRYNKSRIIYAIPFTSIIEQNAQVFRDFLGDEAVLEHHGNLDQPPDRENLRSRLAAENWDSAVIVTTNVQLFESLHAARTSRCRKLHNIVNSIIILDEAQQLPRDFHAPITQVMQQLSDHFGVTWVLCTATQPVLKTARNSFGELLFKGLKAVREIIPDPTSLARQLRRVEIVLPGREDARISWSTLAERVMRRESVLVIVNTRRDAKALYQALADDGNNLHLSASMCAEHRTRVIKEIKQRLQLRREGDHRPIRVVSTQLIEAGVDVDFSVVYRAMAGLDAIAQSAGRCNREGKLNTLGQAIIFSPECPSPPGFLRQGEETTRELLISGQLMEPLSPDSFSKYFALLNARGDRDKHNILPLLKARQSQDEPLSIGFRSAAEKFKLIDESGIAIIVPYSRPEDAGHSAIENWISLLEQDASQRWVYRKLQRYSVSVPESLARELEAENYLKPRAGLLILLPSAYHNIWGVE